MTLWTLAASIGARRVFELGSGFGYSAYWFAKATGADGEIHLTDGDAANERKAADYLGRAGVWDRVTYHVGDALTSFAAVEGEFDVVYDDIDKQGYPDAWRAASGPRARRRPLHLRQHAVVRARASRRRAARRPDRCDPRAQRGGGRPTSAT